MDEIENDIIKRPTSTISAGNITVKGRTSTGKDQAGRKTRTILICSLVFGATLISSAAFIWAVMRWKRKEAVVVAAKEEEDSCEVERGHVEIEAELGKGCFGTVFKGTFKDLRQV